MDRPPLIEKQDQGNKVPMKRPLLLPSDEVSKFESCKKKSKTSAMWKIGTPAYRARMKRESKRTNNRSVSVDLTMERSDMAVDDLPSFASPWEVLDADIKRLETGGWLNTALINAGQALLKKRLPEINGSQDVFYARTLTFQPLTHEFVQIINCADQHWVCATTKIFKPNVVKIYDSMRAGDLTMEQKNQ